AVLMAILFYLFGGIYTIGATFETLLLVIVPLSAICLRLPIDSILENPERLYRHYLRGINNRSLLLYQLKAFWVSPMLLLALTWAVIGLVLTPQMTPARRTELWFWLVCLPLSMAIFRAGWWDWPRPKLWDALRDLMQGIVFLVLLMLFAWN